MPSQTAPAEANKPKSTRKYLYDESENFWSNPQYVERSQMKIQKLWNESSVW